MLFSIVASRVQRYTPLCVCPFSAMRKLFKTLVGGPPPIPRQGSLSLPCERFTSEAATRPWGAENERLDWLERSMLTVPAGCAAAQLGVMKKASAEPFSGVQVKGYRTPRFRARTGPFCQGLGDPIFPLLQSVFYSASALPQIGDGLLHTKRRLYANGGLRRERSAHHLLASGYPVVYCNRTKWRESGIQRDQINRIWHLY